jgi:SAM (Sterile alpha motif) domain-containing protein
MVKITEWLAKLGMSEYAERFAENRIDFAVLPDLTDQDLKDIGVVLGDRRKILRAIARLDAAPEDVVLEPNSPVTLSIVAGQVLPIEAMSREQGDVTPEEVDPDAGGGPQRANYYRLVTRAVKGFESTAEARQVIYERARKALIAHLRFNQPGLSKTAIVKERFALEDAIRKIEAEATRRSRKEIPTELQPATSPIGMPDDSADFEPPRRDVAKPIPADMPEGDWPAAVLDARKQPLNGRRSLEKRSVKGFRDIVGDFRAIPAPAGQPGPQLPELPDEEELVEPAFDPEDFNWPKFDIQRGSDFELADVPEDEPQMAFPRVRAKPGIAPKDERTRRAFSYSGPATLVVALAIIIGSVAATFWQWSAITGFYQFLSHTGLKLQDPANQITSSEKHPKLSGRVPQHSE